jgi:triosephosphate isomerase
MITKLFSTKGDAVNDSEMIEVVEEMIKKCWKNYLQYKQEESIILMGGTVKFWNLWRKLHGSNWSYS